MSVTSLTSANAARWSKAKIKSGKTTAFLSVAKRLCASGAKSRYMNISARTGVPWFIIAVIHERESSQRWDRSIAQGDPWDKRSTHVPAGRGPFKSFEDAAYDALMKCAPYAGKWTDWSAGGALTLLEHYNGLGYANKGRPSPYIWAGTDQYASGKYVADGKYDPNVVDTQLGCAGLIMAMAKLDDSVSFGDKAAALISTQDDSDDDVDDPASDSQAVVPAGVTPDDAVPAPTPVVVAANVQGDPDIFSVQTRLKAMKFNPGLPNGIWGGMTAGAIAGFINDRELSISIPGSLDQFQSVLPDLKLALSKAESEGYTRPVTDDRAAADPKTVAQVAPEVVPAKRGFLATAGAAIAAFFTAIWDTIVSWFNWAWDLVSDHKDDVPTDTGTLGHIWEYVQKVPHTFWWLLGAGLLAALAWNAHRGVKQIVTAVQTGERQ